MLHQPLLVLLAGLGGSQLGVPLFAVVGLQIRNGGQHHLHEILQSPQLIAQSLLRDGIPGDEAPGDRGVKVPSPLSLLLAPTSFMVEIKASDADSTVTGTTAERRVVRRHSKGSDSSPM